VLGKPVGSGQNQLSPLQAIPGLPQTSSASQSHSIQSITHFRESKPLQQAVQIRLPPFQAIPVKPKPNSFFQSHSSHAKNNLLYFKPFQYGQNRLLTFLNIPGRPKPTSTSTSHSSHAKTDHLYSKPSGQVKIDFLPSKPFQSGQNRLPHSKPIQSGQNQLPTLQAIPVGQKLTSSIPCHSRQAKTNFRHSKLFQSVKNLLQTYYILSHFSQSNIVNKFSLLSLPCRSWSPNYSVLVRIGKVTNLLPSQLSDACVKKVA
jgi:hypothetical protein